MGQTTLFDTADFRQMENGICEGHLLALIFVRPKFKVVWYPVDQIIDQWTFQSGPLQIDLMQAKFKRMVNISKRIGEGEAVVLKELYESEDPANLLIVQSHLLPIHKNIKG